MIKRHSSSISTIVTSSCGQYILSGGLDYNAILYDLEDPSFYKIYSYHNNYLTAVAISPDNQLILTSGLDKIVYLINTFTGELRFKLIEQNDVMSLQFSHCGK